MVPRAMSPFAAPTFTAWWRSLKGRPRTRGDAFIALLVAYVLVILFMRFYWAFQPWTMQGDWKQWIWQYHRYWMDGAFPPGHVITDYQFRVQPPVYYVVMAALSHVMHPGVAARLLALVAWGLALVGMYRATSRLSHWTMGLAAVVVLSHDAHVFSMTTGGYPRSFGISLVLLFLDAWLARRHVTVLVLLLFMAGLYPSVLPACGLAYGVATCLSSLWNERLATFARKTASLVVTAALCAAIGLSQNLLALDWWGPVISYADGVQLEALKAGGRMRWVPHGGYFENVGQWITQPWETAGALAHYGLAPWPAWFGKAVGGVVVVALLLLTIAMALKQRARIARFPWEPVLLVLCTLLSYFAARELAFRLYLPLRVLQHILPITMVVVAAALSWQVAHAVRRHGRVRQHVLAFALLLGPVFTVGGDGFLLPAWGDYAHREPELAWIRANTPITAQFAGDIPTCDLIPYFTGRQVYVNWTMAHPFRLGYWAEMERRLRRVHSDLIYAMSRNVVVRFIRDEKIDYIVIDPERFENPDLGRRLFHPIRDHVMTLFERRDKSGRAFILASPPPEAVVFADSSVVIIDAAKLIAAWSKPAPRPAPSPGDSATPAP